MHQPPWLRLLAPHLTHLTPTSESTSTSTSPSHSCYLIISFLQVPSVAHLSVQYNQPYLSFGLTISGCHCHLTFALLVSHRTSSYPLTISHPLCLLSLHTFHNSPSHLLPLHPHPPFLHSHTPLAPPTWPRNKPGSRTVTGLSFFLLSRTAALSVCLPLHPLLPFLSPTDA